MPEHEPVQGDETDRRAMRAIFADTGHRTLNALLIVSGGATVAFMSFLGAAAQQHDLDIVKRIGPDGLQRFAVALQYFFKSLLWAVLAHGTTYASHAAHHRSASLPRLQRASRVFNRVGEGLMWLTAAVCAVCFYYLLRGGYTALDGFKAVAQALAGPS